MKTIHFVHRSLVMMLILATGGIASAADPVSKQIEGHWGVDKAFLLEKAKQQSGGEIPPAMLPMIEMMAMKIVMTFKDGKAEMLSEKGEGSYKITDADAAAGTCVMELTEPEGKQSKKLNVEIQGDTMNLTPVDNEDDKMRMLRMSEEEFEKRKAASAEPATPPAPVPAAPAPTGGAEKTVPAPAAE